MWRRMRYILKHSRVYSGKKASTFHVLLPIQGNLWADELWDLLHCAQKKHYVKKHHSFFFFFLYGSSSYVSVCLKLLLSFTWGKWMSSLAFWPALTLPCHFARRCSSLSGALAQQPQHALMLCGAPWVTLFKATSLHAFYGALFSAWALCYHSACSQPHCFSGIDNT